MSIYLKLFRVKHYLKNFLIFLPLFFSSNILNFEMSIKGILGFFVFCLTASSVYIFNDLMDVEQDRKHPEKKNRPIASGKISEKKAKVILIAIYGLIIIIQFLLSYFKIYNSSEILYSSVILLIYVLINILYSKYFKKIAIIDVITLAFGFILRIIYGGVIISVSISSWLYLTILSISLYMALGKRKGELKKSDASSRKVLQYYNNEFLDKFMHVFLNSAIIFYSLWCTMGFTIPEKTSYLIYSIIFVIFIIMRYSLDLEGNSSGDPTDVIYGDKVLLLSGILYGIYMGGVIYA